MTSQRLSSSSLSSPPSSSSSSSLPSPSASIHFRVRCETLGHGEQVYLCREAHQMRGGSYSNSESAYDVSPTAQWRLPLHTTASLYPWYRALRPVSLKLSLSSKCPEFRYRYQIYRGGVPHRWEKPSDCSHHRSKNRIDRKGKGQTDDGGARNSSETNQSKLNAAMKKGIPENSKQVNGKSSPLVDYDFKRIEERHDEKSVEEEQQHELSDCHFLPLNALEHGETYVVRDVLGLTVESVPKLVMSSPHNRRSSVSTLHSRGALHRAHSSGMRDGTTRNKMDGELRHRRTENCNDSPMEDGAGGVQANNDRKNDKRSNKKAVGFAAVPTSERNRNGHNQVQKTKITKPTTAEQHQQQQSVIRLDSNDGLIVVSAFLPILLDRDASTGAWSAVWDDEALLSMQTTHLRVTRVGSVRWNGDEGVPTSERLTVEACIRALDCVPVWMDKELFQDMYNGFCKGVLWPIMHNLTSVYTSIPRRELNDTVRSEVSHENGDINRHNSNTYQYTPPNRDVHVSIYDRGRQKELWISYNSVNLKFAEVVAENYNTGDLIWIHGFHLMILPTFLRRRIPMSKIGIFLHTPFPSSEIFRTTWFREDLLRGMLNADQVGFHLFEYTRHFLTCCRRLLGLNADMTPNAAGGQTLAIDVNGRHVAVTNIHAGIEPLILYRTLYHEATQAQARRIRVRYPGKTIFCSVDRLESLNGIPLKLLGVKRFLERCDKKWVGKIVLIQIGISAFERGDDYLQTRREVLKLVQIVNSRWPGTIHFEERADSAMRLYERLALMQAADVVLVTPVRYGLSLVPLEYALVHGDALTLEGRRDKRKRGICILSEFSSCARVMRGALKVNPWMVSEIANSFYQALTMADEERLRRLSISSEYVRRVTTERWAHAVLLDLKGVYKSATTALFFGAGLGGRYRQITMEKGFNSLKFSPVLSAFKNSRSRLILLDYGGTIVSNDNLDSVTRFQMVRDQQSHSVPSDDMMYAIEELCMDRRNVVFVVSGKERHSLTDVFGHIPYLGLAAEHGMFVTWPTSNTWNKRQWEKLVPIADQQEWRSIAMAIMEVYKSRTSGSYMEETEMKVLWQYRDADPEFGYLQAKELEDNLAKYLHDYSVDILHGGLKEGGYVEVRPKGVNKGVLAMKIVKNYPLIAQRNQIEFALVLGDDHCDEPMLSVMRQIGHRAIESKRGLDGEGPLPYLPSTIARVDVSPCDEYVSLDIKVYTCTIGKKPSAAEHYLHDVDQVSELLHALVKISARHRRRCYSLIEFQRGRYVMDYQHQPRRSASCGDIEITTRRRPPATTTATTTTTTTTATTTTTTATTGASSSISSSSSGQASAIQFVDGVIPSGDGGDGPESESSSWAARLNGHYQDGDGDVLNF